MNYFKDIKVRVTYYDPNRLKNFEEWITLNELIERKWIEVIPNIEIELVLIERLYEIVPVEDVES